MPRLIVLLFVAGCGNSQPPAPAPAPAAPIAPEETTTVAAPPPVEAQGGFTDDVLQTVTEHEVFAEWTLAPLREYRRGNRTMLIVWPLFDADGALNTDDDTLAVMVERAADGSLAVVGEIRNVIGVFEAELYERMGGEEVQAFPPAGVAADQVGPMLETAPRTFTEAASAGNHDLAAVQVSRLATLYASDTPSQLENIAEILLGVSGGRFVLSHVATEPGSGGGYEVQMSLEDPNGTVSPLVLHLRQNQEGRWVFGGEN